jgi:F-type H+-transporting ATPase subunit a
LDNLHISLGAEELFSIGPLPFTNSFLMMLVVMVVILLVGRWTASGLKEVPDRKQGAAEMVVEIILNLVEGSGGKKLGRQAFPLVGALFIFIICANYTGLLPGIGTIGIEHEATAEEVAADEEHTSLTPFFRPPTADLNMTVAMALISFTAVQVYGIRVNGLGGRLKHMATPLFMFPIEIISELSRIISLAARLFGNVFAGEVLLTVMYTLAAVARYAVLPFAIPVIFLGLEMLFGFIQALVFSLLTMIYISLAAAHGSDEAHSPEVAHEPEAEPARPALGTAGD